MVILDGRPNVSFLALCVECNAGRAPDDLVPEQFATQRERDEWAALHRGGTGHEVREALQIC